MPGQGPLQILTIDENDNVEMLCENLEIISNSLKAENAQYVSIISVMGTYRTGKSFLLDLLMRYLRHRAAKEEQMTNVSEEIGSSQPARRFHQEWSVDCAEKGVTLPLPEWVKEGDSNRISEGADGREDDRGFGWRGGKEKCTSGIWLWRKPFIFVDSRGRRIGVLLMDTQGAWDSKMSADVSATYFGLTALLSSKLIYNIQNRVEEDKISNLDYFTSFAEKACGEINYVGDGKAPFGLLQLLIRDWSSYEEGWNLAKCKEQMEDHMYDHLDPARLNDTASKERVERLQKCFHKLDCFGLVHPGLKVTKTNYRGELDAIDQDFFHLLDSFVEQLFGEDFPCPSAPLGSELTTNAFAQTVKNFGEAFAGSRGMAIGLREAFVKVQMMQEKEALVKQFKAWLAAEYPDTVVVEPQELETKMAEQKEEFKKKFRNQLSPFRLKQSEEDDFVDELMKDLSEASNIVMKTNNAQVDGATVKVIATPVVGCAAWFAITHAWLIAIGASFGAWVSMKKHASINQTDEFCHSAVIKGVLEDTKKFSLNRYRDLQAMSIAAQRLEPDKIMNVVMGAGMKAQAAVASGMAEEAKK